MVENGKNIHPSSSKGFYYGVKPDVNIQLESPVLTKRIRFNSTHSKHFNIREFRIYKVNQAAYPDPLSETADSDIDGLENLARHADTKITSSGVYKADDEFKVLNCVDGNIGSRWTTQAEGEKWLEFEFNNKYEIGCIQFINGWIYQGSWTGLITDYKVQYYNEGEWIDLAAFDVRNGEFNFAKDFHTYALEWNENELVFFLDGEEIRREKNEFCHSPAPVWLSLAILPWAGEITDAIDQTKMEVDWVRVYQYK